MDFSGISVVVLDSGLWVRGHTIGVFAAGPGPCVCRHLGNIILFRLAYHFVFVWGLCNHFAGFCAFGSLPRAPTRCQGESHVLMFLFFSLMEVLFSALFVLWWFLMSIVGMNLVCVLLDVLLRNPSDSLLVGLGLGCGGILIVFVVICCDDLVFDICLVAVAS